MQTSENQAAMEIKMIAMELKSKNIELAECLRATREKEQALAAENEQFCAQVFHDVKSTTGDNENRVVPYQNCALQTIESNRPSDVEELQHYKAIVEQLMSDRAVFTQRLNDLVNINQHIGLAREVTASIEGLKENGEARLNDNSRALVATNSQPDELGEQLRNLTIENGELAQKLGGAVAEKEFALSSE